MAEQSAVIAPVEQAFCALPFGSTPTGRVLLAGGAGAAFAYFVRPSVSFDANGNPRPWVLFDSKNPQAAVFPYWGFFVVPGVIFGLFL
jgi:hypothetical protein